MTWRTHLLGGIAILWTLPPGVPAESLAIALAFSLLGSLLPDLDAPRSRLSSMEIGGVAWLAPASRLLSRRLGHRGPMHSLPAALIVAVVLGVPLALFPGPLAGVGLTLGYLSHLLLDACTRSGVPLLWPDPTRVHLLPKPLRVVTGSPGEDAVFLLLALAGAAFLLTRL